MVLLSSNLDDAYGPEVPSVKCFNLNPSPACKPPACFIGSYPPVTPPGNMGPFFVNTYYLRPDRRSELPGPIPVRCKDLTNCN
jgi:hypothetical protein